MAWTSADVTLIETAIRTRLAGGAVDSYSLSNGSNLKYMTLKELRALRTEMLREINATTAARVTKASIRYS